MQYPLSDDPDKEDFTAVFNRSPLTVPTLGSNLSPLSSHSSYSHRVDKRKLISETLLSWPVQVEILSSPEQLLSTSGLQASMVVLLGTGLPTTLTTAVAMGGAKTVKVFENLGIASEYAADTFRHPMQRVIGGERASAEVRTPRSPLSVPQARNQALAMCFPTALQNAKQIGPPFSRRLMTCHIWATC
jgi:hypothetical protein